MAGRELLLAWIVQTEDQASFISRSVSSEGDRFPRRAIIGTFSDQAITRQCFDWAVQSSEFLIICIHIQIMCDRGQFLAVPDLPQPDLLAHVAGLHHDGEYVDPGSRERPLGALFDAMSLGNDLLLARRNDVTPVGLNTNRQDTGVVLPQGRRVVQPQAGVVHPGAHVDRVALEAHVVRFHHVEAGLVRVQRVASFQREGETLWGGRDGNVVKTYMEKKNVMAEENI